MMPVDEILTEEQRAAFVMAETHPLREGLGRVFEGIKNGEYIAACDPKLSSDLRHYSAGRMQMLMDLEGFLEELFSPAVDTDSGRGV